MESPGSDGRRRVDDIGSRFRAVTARVAEAAIRAGRDPADVTIVAVSKRFPASYVEAAAAAGVTDVGENRIQEAEPKIQEVSAPVRWRLVGSLQSNKARRAVCLFHSIDSVDSARLLRRLDALALEQGVDGPEALIQVNVTGESTKHGVAPGEIEPLLEAAEECQQVRVNGLMTMAPFTEDESVVRDCFRRTRDLARSIETMGHERVRMDQLSMGMTGDFEIAIEEGATIVRLGTAIFGQRP
ncbi:YggS family pyridoxal phosphate-dependent enzyme [Candidatus Poribacteria bacterium]|nr:YggS family pyridoxal phosphate-dependent enzyme [Candidatus Poribacteria bacterium]MBT5535045.1 YggS family pyridoxal phosphate-dependent enzyme [Candidatus Poribacteria bacterium]MBT5712810.1 YggS family pyridoxal phosphate-dependent enzyme [Candidatus Poribacteria bacterium]MBT7098380.1 YggS family pyridoxal phosphate-dependent enzyme [Candidatus Poribacteria bacterium]